MIPWYFVDGSPSRREAPAACHASSVDESAECASAAIRRPQVVGGPVVLFRSNPNLSMLIHEHGRSGGARSRRQYSQPNPLRDVFVEET